VTTAKFAVLAAVDWDRNGDCTHGMLQVLFFTVVIFLVFLVVIVEVAEHQITLIV
jgi:hypothetical protein